MKKFLSMLLAMIMVLGVVGASAEAVTYERGDDEDIYEEVLGDFEGLMAAAEAAETIDERFVLEAQAEAYLLDSAVMIPTTTQGGAYTMTRIAYRTVPYANWGNDDDRWGTMVAANELIKKEDREVMKEAWKKTVAGEEAYDPAKILTDLGYTLANEYKTTFSTAPVTLDWLNTSSQSDTEITVNCVDGLVQYNNLNQLCPAMAESWEVSDDGTVYTFHIREGAKWFTSEGEEYADVTAGDFVAGFHHMLDAKAGLEWLVEGVVKGASEYLAGGSFDEVGYEAVDDQTLVITLEGDIPYFMTMLTYSCFLPICEDWYLSHGGVYGAEEYQAAFADTEAYTFGKNTDVASQVYSGPFLLQKLNPDSEIAVVKNPNYYRADEVTINSITWIYDNGENMKAFYDDVVSGVYAGSGLTEASGTLKMAKDDGNFEKYAYVSDTTSTTYFGGLNVNRGTFALESGAAASPKTEQQKIDTHNALMNKNFRKAIAHGWDRATVNATSRGEDLKLANIRNMYTHPEFVSLENATKDADGHEFAAGTFYGEMVQYYLDQMGGEIKVADAIDGWYNADLAKDYLAKAKEELGDSVTWPITIDIVYYSASEGNTAQAQVSKQTIEETLGAENVVVNLVETTTSADFYACGYRAASGEAGNFDFFYGSGWGPDYGDPSTYLDTFGVNGYMLKVIGVDY
jgi:ABC-type oligopeptide transport system substrate-binding subunit